MFKQLIGNDGLGMEKSDPCFTAKLHFFPKKVFYPCPKFNYKCDKLKIFYVDISNVIWVKPQAFCYLTSAFHYTTNGMLFK